MTTTLENIERLLDLLAVSEHKKFHIGEGWVKFCDKCSWSKKWIDEQGEKCKKEPIKIGDVLDKYLWEQDDLYRVYEHWEPCGIAKSLQEIVEASGYEAECKSLDFEPSHKDCEAGERLKNPSARSLFEFLFSIFLPNEK